MSLTMQKLKEINFEAQELQHEKGYKEVKGVLNYQGLFFVPKAI